MKSILLSFILLAASTLASAQDTLKRKIKVILPTFKTYHVDSIYTGRAARTDFSTTPQLKLFRTVIKAGYKTNKLNFAGHYCLVTWGCGSDCQGHAIIDLKDGKVYDAPGSGSGCAFKKNSRMVVVNPPQKDNLIYDYSLGPPEVWIFDEQTKKFTQKKVRFYPKLHPGPRED